MKIIIEHEGISCTIYEDTVLFCDAVELFKRCAVGVGYQPDTIKEYFEEQE